MTINQRMYLAAILIVQNSDEYLSIETSRYADWALLSDVCNVYKRTGAKPLELSEMYELNSGYMTRQQTGRWNGCKDIVRLTAKGKIVAQNLLDRMTIE